MAEFTQEIPKALRDEEAKEVNRILVRLGEFGFTHADVESVMDVLTAREDLNRARRSIGPRLIEFAEEVLNKTPDTKVTILLDRIKEQIEARCSKADFQQSKSYYEKFVKGISTSWDVHGTPWVFHQIFTTNYDRCIEEFLEGHPYEDGFEALSGRGRVFTANWPETETSTYTLCKLHGSIDWFEIGGRVYQFPFVPGQSLTNKQVTGRMMVYPASEKYALTSPYAECLFYLRRSLMMEKREPKLVVVGYSFRDDSINNAFIDALRINPSLRIFSLRPQASAHQYELEEPLRSRVVPVDGEFGSDKTIQKLNTAMSGG